MRETIMTRTPLAAIILLLAPLFCLRFTVDSVSLGVVQSESGSILSGASVRFQGQASCTRTDRLGRFQLPAGSGRVTASKPGYRIGWASVGPGPLRIQLAPLPSEDNANYAWIAPDADAAWPNNCANCHQEIHRQWAGGGHARSATNPKLLALLGGPGGTRAPLANWNLRERHPDGAGVCAVCHAPTFRDPSLEYDLRAVKDVAARGVHCDYCHKIADAPTDKLGTRFGRDGYSLLRPPDGDLLSFGPLDDAVRPGESFAHAPFYKESRYCASCHEGVLFGVHVYGTYSEWLQSPARRAGQHCQSCHMAPTGMTNVAPGNGGVERDPRSLAGHGIPGGTLEMLRKCLKLDVSIDKTKGQTRVTTELRAVSVGHRVPTGFIDRHLVLLVEASGGSGQSVAAVEGPTVERAAGRHLAGRAGWLYAKRLHAGDYSPLAFWIAPDGVIDTRLDPERPDCQVFVFPSAATHVRTRVVYRRFWPEVAEPLDWQDNELLVIERNSDAR
jgi:hypothetical protein